MKKGFLFLSVLLFTAGVSIAQKKGKSSNAIPFTVAKNYFVSNTFQQGMLTNPAIYSQAEFDAIFGAATVKGKNGAPTAIDFSKQYVIAVIPPATDKAPTLKAVSLTKSGDIITLKYSYKEGAKLTYTSQPYLLLVVDAKYKGTVRTLKI
ncbi:MAG: hypothetical protein NTW29_06600 [Bacteroidetes bacterium]|nr:hypothetical protein [Bacteroidota bacterium]